MTLESLLKLRELKAVDKRTSALQYMVSALVRGNADLLNFADDFADLQVCGWGLTKM